MEFTSLTLYNSYKSSTCNCIQTFEHLCQMTGFVDFSTSILCSEHKYGLFFFLSRLTYLGKNKYELNNIIYII